MIDSSTTSHGDAQYSPFLRCSVTTQADQLALIHLRRDHLIPTVLQLEDADDEGYDEGKVTNTRFGSFPHSTLVGLPWGSQVRASVVDTGSRGRRNRENAGQSRKRKRDANVTCTDEIAGREEDSTSGLQQTSRESKIAKEAASGFIHILPPTPELWTVSLPHRTQVVYTPDYSYVLHRLRARPGSRIIEAGAGSGSFTHAAARAVFGGNLAGSPLIEAQKGRVFSFEFHEQRYQKLQQEMADHRLLDLVELTLRDVCRDGFHPEFSPSAAVMADAVFLDMPAPWLAVSHLNHEKGSVLNPQAAVHLCTFSPCIEQVQRTVQSLRQLGWLEIEVVEIAARRIEVRRDRVGIHEEGLRGVDDSPVSVSEALQKLREVEGRTRPVPAKKLESDVGVETDDAPHGQDTSRQTSKQERLKRIRDAQEGRKTYKEGQLVTKTEQDVKAHTSYLVFAVLPRQWTEEDELRTVQRFTKSK